MSAKRRIAPFPGRALSEVETVGFSYPRKSRHGQFRQIEQSIGSALRAFGGKTLLHLRISEFRCLIFELLTWIGACVRGQMEIVRLLPLLSRPQQGTYSVYQNSSSLLGHVRRASVIHHLACRRF